MPVFGMGEGGGIGNNLLVCHLACQYQQLYFTSRYWCSCWPSSLGTAVCEVYGPEHDDMPSEDQSNECPRDSMGADHAPQPEQGTPHDAVAMTTVTDTAAVSVSISFQMGLSWQCSID